MAELLWILGSGLLMCAVASVGGLALFLSNPRADALVETFVPLAAGSLLGGALFHMLPESVEMRGNSTLVWVWVAIGFTAFLFLEKLLHWHHHHGPMASHRRPVTFLLLFADGMHNFVGGLAVGGAFLVDVRLGIVTWLVAALHELPQELGDYGVLVNGGWTPRGAILANVIGATPFLLGGLVAWVLSGPFDVALLLAIGAGNFLYIAGADLVPEFKHSHERAGLHVAAFVGGLGVLLVVRVLLGH